MLGSKRSGYFRWRTIGLIFMVLGIILSGFAVEGNAENENSEARHNSGVNDNNGYSLVDGSIAKHRVKRATLKSCREVSLKVGSKEKVGEKEQEKKVQVQWEVVDGDNVKFEVAAHVAEGEYIGLGFSATQETNMVKADAVICFMKGNEFFAVDHFLTAYSQCSAKAGACADEMLGGNNDATAVSGERIGGHNVIRFTRPIKATDTQFDLSLEAERTFFIAIGKMDGNTALVHSDRFDKTSLETMNVMGSVDNTCVLKENFVKRVITSGRPIEGEKFGPWRVEEIRDTTVFNVTLGPPGGSKGFPNISGLGVAWGESYYVNNLLIPRLYVIRGKTYTFHVNAGSSHPLYITKRRKGGYQKGLDDNPKYTEKIFEAGPEGKGVFGQKCKWKENGKGSLEEYVKKSGSIKEFVEKLKLICEGPVVKNNILTWKVLPTTPNIVYYQCYEHYLLGFQIHVHNEGEQATAYPVPPETAETGETDETDVETLMTANKSSGQDARMPRNFIIFVSTSAIVTMFWSTIFSHYYANFGWI